MADSLAFVALFFLLLLFNEFLVLHHEGERQKN